MSRTSVFVLWFLSVVGAAMFGWFTGVNNATRVAQGGAHLVMWLFFIAIIAVGGAVAYFSYKARHHGRTPNDPLMH